MRSHSNPTSLRFRPRGKFSHAALTLVALCAAAGGCGCPEMSAYREGLNAVNEPLYAAHLMLLDEAVAGGTRSEADRQTVRGAVAAARALYEESRRAEAAPVP